MYPADPLPVRSPAKFPVSATLADEEAAPLSTPAAAGALPTGPELVARTRALLERFPSRLTGTAGERGLQEACASELTKRGGVAEWHDFRWGLSIYASLAFHFGLATFGVVLGFFSPIAAACVHAVVAISYASESVRKRPLLRHLLPSVASQNLIVTFAARKPMKHRIVTLAHADAAYTGLLFTPSIVRSAAKETSSTIGRIFRKGLGVATFTVLALAALELAMTWLPPSAVWRVLACLLALPSLMAFVLNLDVVVRNQVVPAANDNLSGCVASLELARRLVLPDDVELVTVITGCEEAGAGGATNLARSIVASGRWSPAETTVLALDTFSGGDVRLLQEGELWPAPLPPKLVALAAKVCAEDPSLGDVPPYEIPSGATDAWPFYISGFESMGITCIDPDLGAPQNYHLPSDTADNLDPDKFARSYAFTEAFIKGLAAERSRIRGLASPSSPSFEDLGPVA